MTGPRLWTADRDALLKQCHSAGMTVREAGEKLGATGEAVRSRGVAMGICGGWAHKLTWTNERVSALTKMHGEGLSYKAIAARLDLTPQAVVSQVKRMDIRRRAPLKFPTASAWTPAAEADLRRRWEAGETITEISRAVGVGRGGIAGKAHRMGLTRRPGPSAKTPHYKPPAPQNIMPIRAPRPETPPAPHSGPLVAMLDMKAHSCRWPFGEGSGVLFCGHRQTEGKPYCEAHCKVAYVVPAPRLHRRAA